jgi:hypothetical protein
MAQIDIRRPVSISALSFVSALERRVVDKTPGCWLEFNRSLQHILRTSQPCLIEQVFLGP